MSDIRSVCLSHLDVQLVNIFLTEAARVESTQNNTLHTDMKPLCLARSQPKTTLRVRLPPPPPPPPQQLLILLSGRASPQPERWPCPERFVPRRIKHVTGPPGNQGRWVRRGNSSSRRSFVFSDPPLVQIIMSDSQMCPSLEMWLMSHLVSEDLGAGFEWRIKGTASFIRNTGSRWVMASLRLLRLASDWMVATFFRDWGGSGVKEVSWSPTVMFRKGRDKSCLSADVKVSNVGTIQRKIFYTF